MMYAYLIKSRKNSDKPNLFVWFESKSDSRADREVMNILEDAEIETGRGADHQLPVRTNMPVFDDLPEESKLDATWCDRYELGDDNATWKKIVATEPKGPQKITAETASEVKVPSREKVSERLNEMRNLSDEDIIDSCKLPFNTEVAHYWLGGMFTATPNERKAATVAAMDTDNSYLQNILLAFNSVEPCKHCYDHIRNSLVEIIKSIWPVEGKSPELNNVLTFTQEWMAAINDNSDTDGVKRKSITEKWRTRYSKQRTESGATAGGSNQTDRNPEMVHSLDTLDIEIALALLPFDFNIYDFEQSILRRGKEMVAAKESPWKEWSRKLRNSPGILDYSRAAIFAVIRSAAPNIHMMPGSHQAWINDKLTETNHANPDAETVALAMRSTASVSTHETSDYEVPETIIVEVVSTSNAPEVQNLGNGVFSIEGLMGEQPNKASDIKTPLNEVVKEEVKLTETTSNEPMETTDSNQIADSVEISTGQNTDANDQEATAVTEAINSEASVEFPAYFEPGRYVGLPNDVYHGANGISSTQVKDARVSLMYFHGRHITKTIGRETSDALTFGTLVHALSLEPECFDAEFAVFPGVPDGAFTNTDSLKAFIREYNEGKDKSEQLKLTGTKDVLSLAIRKVKPDAIFADEFEQQWNEANKDKIILSERQLTHAKAIQQALFNHPSAGQLLQHPNRANEVSYFGMDEETGLEVRVRPDLEIDMAGVRIGVDLKTISLGKVKQDFLRAKLHREIIERDYHLSAAMYCDVADFNQFFWIFVNKDEGYHWVAIIEASEELLELGRLEYRKAINSISNALDSDVWPAPITEDYTDELNDFDVRRLEALRLA
jgi:exodeoxyribonuclease VIII